MIAAYQTAVKAMTNTIGAMAQKKPVADNMLQQAILKVELALDRACTEPSQPDAPALLLELREQLLTTTKYLYYAQPSQY